MGSSDLEGKGIVNHHSLGPLLPLDVVGHGPPRLHLVDTVATKRPLNHNARAAVLLVLRKRERKEKWMICGMEHTN
jgi:hypothetical protein